jgi:hypothetical protein
MSDVRQCMMIEILALPCRTVTVYYMKCKAFNLKLRLVTSSGLCKSGGCRESSDQAARLVDPRYFCAGALALMQSSISFFIWSVISF